jgi:hypothetical protein
MLERFGFVFCEVTGFDQLVDQRLVFGQLPDLPLAKHVGAAVTDLRKKHDAIDEYSHGCRRAHAAA